MGNVLTHSTAPNSVFQGGVKKRLSESTLSKPRPSSRGVEGLTTIYVIKNTIILLDCQFRENDKAKQFLNTGLMKPRTGPEEELGVRKTNNVIDTPVVACYIFLRLSLQPSDRVKAR